MCQNVLSQSSQAGKQTTKDTNTLQFRHLWFTLNNKILTVTMHGVGYSEMWGKDQTLFIIQYQTKILMNYYIHFQNINHNISNSSNGITIQAASNLFATKPCFLLSIFLADYSVV